MPDIKMHDILSEMARGLSGTWVVMVADRDGMVLSSWESPDNRISPEAFGGFIQIINIVVDLPGSDDVLGCGRGGLLSN